MQLKSIFSPYTQIRHYLASANPFYFKKPKIDIERPKQTELLAEINKNKDKLFEIPQEDECENLPENMDQGLGRIVYIQNNNNNLPPTYQISIIKNQLHSKHSLRKKKFLHVSQQINFPLILSNMV